MKLAILIPAYNEETTLGHVIETLPKTIPGISDIKVIVVNDGSADKTKEIAQASGATVISHWFNRGLGGALGTGFEYIRRHDFDLLITFDADGQHNPNDIAPVIKPIIDGKADVSIGSRFIGNLGSMPWYRRIGIFGLNVITYMLFWTWTTDSQSGMRAFGRKAIEKIEIQTNKMEVSSEFFYEIQAKNLKLTEVPIQSIYTDYSIAKGQKNINAFNILAKLIYRRFFSK
ncbi:MAG: glycosyltransferase family 2 protein [Candidatus Berkelbacteria bacterium]